jgi:hypothetical protein
MAKRKVESQITNWSQKVKNRHDSFACRWRATCRWKALNEGYNFSLDLVPIGGLHQKLWSHKVVGLPALAISGFPLGSPEKKSHLDATPAEWCIVYYMGEGGGFPRVQAVVSLVSLRLPMACPSTKSALKSELTNLLVGLMQVRVSN